MASSSRHHTTSSFNVNDGDGGSEPEYEREKEITTMFAMGLPVSFKSSRQQRSLQSWQQQQDNQSRRRYASGPSGDIPIVTIEDHDNGCSGSESGPEERPTTVKRNSPDDHEDNLEGGEDDSGKWTPVASRKNRSHSIASTASSTVQINLHDNSRLHHKHRNTKKTASGSFTYQGGSKAPHRKYFYGRYKLFSKFDDGIQLDEESWYSVTPEDIAKHIASRILRDSNITTIIDGMCGAGGNTIQFAAYPRSDVRVLAVDIDPVKIMLAGNNARVYSVEDKIEFFQGDFLQLAKSLEVFRNADVVFFSPPWGGPSYLNEPVYKLSSIEPDIKETLSVIREHITENIALLVPRTTDPDDLRELAGEDKFVEIENCYMSGRHLMTMAYFGDLIDYHKAKRDGGMDDGPEGEEEVNDSANCESF